jgi:hypothetical protein
MLKASQSPPAGMPRTLKNGDAAGANGWGSSFVVGAGSTFPRCMQSEIANLAGSLNGRGDIQLGATVDGPSNPSNFVGLGTVSGMRACRAGHFAPYNTAGAGRERRPDADPASLVAASWPDARRMIEAYVAEGLSKFVVRPAGPLPSADRFLDQFVSEMMPLQT